MPVQLDEQTIDEFVHRVDSPSLVDFSAQWCAPCLAMAPALREIAAAHGSEMRFGRLDVDLAPRTATRFRVLGAPTLVFFCRGQEVARVVGFKPAADLRLWIANQLRSC